MSFISLKSAAALYAKAQRKVLYGIAFDGNPCLFFVRFIFLFSERSGCWDPTYVHDCNDRNLVEMPIVLQKLAESNCRDIYHPLLQQVIFIL